MRQLDLYLKSRDILFSNQDDKILIELNSRSDITKNKAKQLYKYWALRHMDQANIKGSMYMFIMNQRAHTSFIFTPLIFKILLVKIYEKYDTEVINQYSFSSVDFVINIIDLEEVL